MAAERDVDVAAMTSPPEGLRERKKRLTRQHISDTATWMFLERGFDEVRVTEIAEASGVSEKTVYNYFPTKESLVLDREEDTARSIRAALGPGGPEKSPIEAILEVLHRDLDRHYALVTADAGPLGMEQISRFNEMVASTPALQAAQRDMIDRLGQVAAEAMAERAHISPDDPEPQIAAHAILGLWQIMWQSVQRHADAGSAPDEMVTSVKADLDRAARLLDGGLWAFAVMVSGNASRDQLRAAAEAAQRAARQVASAMRQAREAWRQAQQEWGAHGGGHHHGGPHYAGDRRAQRQQFEQWKRERIQEAKARKHR